MTDPFAAKPEQVAEAVAKDPFIARLAEVDAELRRKREEMQAPIDAAQAEVTRYRKEVIEPAERAYKAVLAGLRPLIGRVRSARNRANAVTRKRMSLLARRSGRISRIKEAIARKNLAASQKELVASFRNRRKKRRLDLPEFTQTPLPVTQWNSNSMPTESTTSGSAPPTGSDVKV